MDKEKRKGIDKIKLITNQNVVRYTLRDSDKAYVNINDLAEAL